MSDEFITHERTSCCQQQATRVTRGRSDVRGSFGWDSSPVSAKRVAEAHSHVSRSVRTLCLVQHINRRMSCDMSRLLNEKQDGTTLHFQVTKNCLPAGEFPNKRPIFISGVSDVRNILVCLRASCLTTHIKGEILMVVPSNADVFRTAVSALRSLNGGDCDFPHLHALGGQLCASSGEESG